MSQIFSPGRVPTHSGRTHSSEQVIHDEADHEPELESDSIWIRVTEEDVHGRKTALPSRGGQQRHPPQPLFATPILPPTSTTTYFFSDQTTHPLPKEFAPQPKPKTKPTTMAATLYRDALHSIFIFLSLKQLVKASQVNYSWSVAVRTLKPRLENDQKSYGVKYSRPIKFLIQSPLKHHIRRLHLLAHNFDPFGQSLLREHLGQLEVLKMRILLSQDDLVQYSSSDWFDIPQRLHELRIEFDFGPKNRWAELNASGYITGWMNAVVAQSTQLVKLDVRLFNAQGVSEMDCPPALHALTTLTDLELPDQFNRDQRIDLIKTLPSLRRTPISPGVVQRLLDGPEFPPLEDIGEIAFCGQADVMGLMNQVGQISTLTKLNLPFGTYPLVDPGPLLSNFPRLSILYIQFCHEIPTNHLCRALSACVTLTDLELEYIHWKYSPYHHTWRCQ